MRWLLVIQLLLTSALVYLARADAENMMISSARWSFPPSWLALAVLAAALLVAVAVPAAIAFTPRRNSRAWGITASLLLSALCFYAVMPMLA